MTPEQIASIPPWLHYVPIFATVVLFLLIIGGLVRLLRSDANDMDWSDLISTRTQSGKQKADWNQIGKGGGVIQAFILPFLYIYSPKMEAFGLAAVMTASFLYLGAVSAYAASLRARQGSVETIKTTEEAPVSRTTETRIETPPVEGSVR